MKNKFHNCKLDKEIAKLFYQCKEASKTLANHCKIRLRTFAATNSKYLCRSLHLSLVLCACYPLRKFANSEANNFQSDKVF